MTRRVALGLVAVLAAGAGGCSVLGGVRREPPPVSAPSPEPVAATAARRGPADAEVRRGGLRIPSAWEQQTVEFADAARGAALFVRCGVDDAAAGSKNACSGRLVVTADGGRTWTERPHPQPVAVNHQLYTGPDGTVLLLAEPQAWYESRDAGRTFRRIPYAAVPPPEYHRLLGEYQVCCESDSRPRVVRYAGARAEPVPVAPPLPGQLRAVTARPGTPELWAASIDGGAAFAAVSRDAGRSWTRSAVPGPPDGLQRLRLLVSADGSDLWLIGEREDRERFPAVWRWTGAGWQQMPAQGRPEAYRNAAATGAGLLAVTGPAGGGLAGERWTPTNWPANGWIRLLRDGALEVSDAGDGSVWLGEGAGVDRRWARIVPR